MRTSPIGLHGGAKQRLAIRKKVFAAARTAVDNRNHTVYTEGWQRWSGIQEDRRSYKHESPFFADCSAMCTWYYWDATRAEKLGDFVNGLGWRGGYTGTMTRYGEDVGLNQLLTADAIFYGGSWDVPAHVALYVGNGKVISHGMPGDPRLYPINLNGALPITRAKRYIR
jgi:cell wall-associated NlpC family hydrolase